MILAVPARGALATFDDEEAAVESITPLQVAELKPEDRPYGAYNL
jgi:hypothetical protein